MLFDAKGKTHKSWVRFKEQKSLLSRGNERIFYLLAQFSNSFSSTPKSISNPDDGDFRDTIIGDTEILFPCRVHKKSVSRQASFFQQSSEWMSEWEREREGEKKIGEMKKILCCDNGKGIWW